MKITRSWPKIHYCFGGTPSQKTPSRFDLHLPHVKICVPQKRVVVDGAFLDSGSNNRVTLVEENRTKVAAPRESTWVRGPAWDSFWMLSAIWLVPIALWFTRGTSDVDSGALDTLYF